MSTTLATTYTPEDLLVMPDVEHCELVNGELVEKPMSAEASACCARLMMKFGPVFETKSPGEFFDASCSYQCFPDDPMKVRRPDASFIITERLKKVTFSRGHVKISPDLAIEVASPNDEVYTLNEKVNEYLSAGVRLIWVIDPNSRVIDIYRADGSTNRLRQDEELSGEDVIPGFSCPVKILFPG